jgi:hypothetical protein
MKQIYLVIYLESKDCVIVREDKSGYFVMRNLKNMKIQGIPLPKSGSNVLNEETITRICKHLEVENPPNSSSPEVEEFISLIDEDVKRRFPHCQ